MKNLFLFLSFLFLISCSVQKRKYQKGYYVEWNHKKNSDSKVVSKKEETKKTEQRSETFAEIKVKGEDKAPTSANAHKSLTEVVKKKFSFLKPGQDSCDLIMFKDGSEIKVKVEEIGINEIKYKRCDMLSGPTYVAKKSDVFMIKYQNGTKELIKSEEPVVNKTPNQYPVNVYKSNKYARVNHPLALPTIILGSLSIFSGYLVLFSLGTTAVMTFVMFLPLIFSVVALIMGVTAIRAINEEPDIYKGKGMAVPGMIMGAVITGIYLIVFTAVLLFA